MVVSTTKNIKYQLLIDRKSVIWWAYSKDIPRHFTYAKWQIAMKSQTYMRSHTYYYSAIVTFSFFSFLCCISFSWNMRLLFMRTQIYQCFVWQSCIQFLHFSRYKWKTLVPAAWCVNDMHCRCATLSSFLFSWWCWLSHFKSSHHNFMKTRTQRHVINVELRLRSHHSIRL